MAPCTLHSRTEEGKRKQRPYNQEDYKTSEYISACMHVRRHMQMCVPRKIKVA